MSLETSRSPRQLGNYDLLALVAEGGMGAVYRGRNRSTGQIVAVKVIPPETARNPLLLKRFEQEFKAATLIDHPNVVKALDYCGTGATPFLVMEFVDGETIGQRVERDGAMPEAEALRLMSQVCDGLNRAHKQGMIHRDVKPDNIMITADGVAKLTDLGLVKDIEGEQNLTRTGRGLGTPHFMAPEQFRNAKAADVRCDIYSLGATLYMMLTGAAPFDKTTPLDCWLRKTKNDFPPPRKFVRGLSDRVNWAVCRAMSCKPDDRPASCREFMEDLLGGPWQSGGQPSSPAALRRPTSDPADTVANDLWYVVYRDAAGELHKVKGTTESVRLNLTAGTFGDQAAVLVCRTKTGQFVPVRNSPAFRDLVVTNPSSAHDLAVLPKAGEPAEPGAAPEADAPNDITAYSPTIPDTGASTPSSPHAAVRPRPAKGPFDWAPYALAVFVFAAVAVAAVFVLR